MFCDSVLKRLAFVKLQMAGRIIIVFLTFFGGCSCSSVKLDVHKPRPKPPAYVCGEDKLFEHTVEEGTAEIESFPWLGLLMYPVGTSTPTKTTVVLVSRQIAIAAALDIDKYPKHDFRARSRVVLGHNRTQGPFIRVRDYTFHPDFARTTYSALALVQLDVNTLRTKIFPICPPPDDFDNAQSIYALSLDHDSDNSFMVNVYRMEYVDNTQCRDFYRRADLDLESMWPTHLACARGQHGGQCVWTGGTALVILDGGKWKLLGLGIYGPGCEAPARFLDYGMYHLWVKRAISKIGHPAITRKGPNHLILRRTTTNVQRFGDCDPEETRLTIFSDLTTIEPPYAIDLEQIGHVKYNVTLQEHVEYHCVVFRVWNKFNATGTPEISLRRWCTNPKPICGEFTMLTIFFYVEITFKHTCSYKVVAYGTEIKYVDGKHLLMYANKKRKYPKLHETSFRYH